MVWNALIDGKKFFLLKDQNSAEEINTETEIKDMNNEGENLD